MVIQAPELVYILIKVYFFKKKLLSNIGFKIDLGDVISSDVLISSVKQFMSIFLSLRWRTVLRSFDGVDVECIIEVNDPLQSEVKHLHSEQAVHYDEI